MARLAAVCFSVSMSCCGCSDSSRAGSDAKPAANHQAVTGLNFDEKVFLSLLLEESNLSPTQAENISRRDLVRLLRRAVAESSRLELTCNNLAPPGRQGQQEPFTEGSRAALPASVTLPIEAVAGELSFSLDEEPLYYEYSFSNNGNEVVAAPILYDRFRWDSAEALIQSGGFREIPNETDRALAIWDFVVKHRYHFMPAATSDEVRDVTKFLSIYGYGFCGTSAKTLSRLADDVGLKGRIWFLEGHIVPEIKADGRWILLDPDLQLYFNDPADPKRIFGVEDLVADPSRLKHFTVEGKHSAVPLRSEYHYDEFPDHYKEILLSTENNHVVEQTWHEGVRVMATADYIIEDRLRPGERIAFTNFNWGKYFLGPHREAVPAFYNGYYELQLSAVGADFATGSITADRRDDGWHIINRSSATATSLALRNRYGFPILGAALYGDVRVIRGKSRILVEDLSNHMRSEFVQPAAAPIVMDSAFAALSATPTYDFSLVIELGPNAEILLGPDARLVSDFQFSKLALAPMGRGLNTLQLYAGNTGAENLSFELRYCTEGVGAGNGCAGRSAAPPPTNVSATYLGPRHCR